MGFQAAVVGGLEGAELAAERLVVPVVGLHVAVQAWGETEKGRWKRVNFISAVPSEAEQSTLQQQQSK